MNRPYRRSAASAALLCWNAARADTLPSAPNDYPIEEIVIRADPLRTLSDHRSAPVAVVKGNSLLGAAVDTLGAAVEQVPGVNVSTFGNAVGRPVIRGLGGARVRVLENGLGAMDVSTVSPDHAVAAEPVFAEQIEIFRGPATLLFGSGASGGLVNVVNRRLLREVPATPAADAFTQYDSASDGWLGAWQLDLPLGQTVAAHADGLRRDSQSISIPGFAAVTPEPDARRGVLPNSSIETDNYAAGLSWVGTSARLSGSVSYLSNDYGVPGGHDPEEPESDPPGLTPADPQEDDGGIRIALEQTRYDLEATLDLAMPGITQARTRWAYADYQHDELEPDGQAATTVSNEETEGRLELILAPPGPLDGVFGLHYGTRRFSAYGEEAFVPATQTDSLGVFLLGKGHLGDWHLDAGLRFEQQTVERRTDRLSVEHDLLSLSLGATWLYGAYQSASLAFTRATRAPTAEELFANGPHLATNTYERGQAGLSKETAHNLEFGWHWKRERAQLELSAFYNYFTDFTYLALNDLNGDGIADRVEPDFARSGAVVDEADALLLLDQAQRDARLWGFEAAVQVTLVNNQHGHWRLHGWSDYVDGELRGGETIPRLPPLRFGARLTWERSPWSAEFSTTRVSAVDHPAPLETATDGYVQLAAGLTYRCRLGARGTLALFARGENLADQTARSHTSFVKDLAPMAGISAVLGARLSY